MSNNVQPALIGSGLAGVGRPYTAELWDGFDPGAMDRDAGLGHYDEVSFVDDVPVVITAQAVANFGNWNAFTATTGATIGAVATNIQGGAVGLAATTDNNEVYLQRGIIGSRPYALVTSSETAAWPYHHLARVRFECRFSPSTVAANVMGFFIGLAGVVADNDLDDDTADVVTTKPFLGFSVLNGAAAENATVRAIYQNATAAPTVSVASLGTLVADRWFNVGFDYYPLSTKPAEWVSWYFNGVKSSTFVTQGATATNFPRTIDGTAMVDLAPSFYIKPGATTAQVLRISNFRISQEFMVAQGNEACA